MRKLFGSIATRYDLANHLLSGGMDFFWRRHAARIVKKWEPKDVLDVATGSGDLALTIQRFCPESTVTGADFCEPMLAQARAKGLLNTVVADALQLPFEDGSFDAVTVAFGLRNMESWSGALTEMHRVLRPGGHVLILDFSIPRPPLRALYRFYLHRVLPKIAMLVTHQKSAYVYLADSIETFPQGPAMQSLLAKNGFTETTAERLSFGIVSLYRGRRG
ncbi:MAG: ubiquinone/menaquinone biosynthesis methyltransferase [Verrucomicrobiota bacterium]|nr:ubiquinone/menaquinone biosynthesis methyltransferase [Verrucomicrobiota bacterium]